VDSVLKLLIADDEYLVLDSLKMIISKHVENVDIVGTASTGREAIEKAINLKPDIVFMDIHMPGIDGIEAIRQIKAANNDIVIVILSAYEYFDYAKEALNLGVIEYLLKPINKSKLIETINMISAEINRKRNNLMREVELTERINNIIPFLEGQFVSDKLFNTGALKEIKFYESIFSMSLKQGYAMTILFESIDSKGKEDSLKLSYEKQSFYDLFKIKLKCLCPCLIGNPLSDRIIAYIPVTGKEDSYEIRNRAIELGKKVAGKIGSAANLNYKIGIGRKYEVENFNKSCNEAYMAATMSSSQSVMHFEDIAPSNSVLDMYPLHKENAFSNSILTGNIKEAKGTFKEIYVWLMDAYGEDIDKIKSKLIELLFIIEKALPYKLKEFNELKQTYILNILKGNSKEELRVQFLYYLSELGSEIQNQRRNDIDGIIPTVLEYLNNNYSADISLNDAAKSVNLSYHYFSKIFKDEIGKSFTDYLTELRIEKSMKLLVNPNTSIKEICQKIGYNDPNYYTKAFKKITGMTPTEYRSSINIRGDYIG
jgi:two-component system, response regulator YesN